MSKYLPFIVIALLLLAGGAYAATRKKKRGADISIEPPATKRTDLLFGYYGTFVNEVQDQVAETLDHVNLVWLWDFLDAQQAAVILSRMPGCFGVLDCANYLFERRDGRLQPRADAEARLFGVFQHLRDAGMLNRIKMLVPVDEPNLSKTNLGGQMPWAAELLRKCAAGFSELDGVLLGCVYLGGKAMPGIELWDVVGFDEYDERSGIFAPGGHYWDFKKQLRSCQRTMVIPGGYEDFQQDPTPFVHFAHANPEVMIVLGFLWASVPWGKEKGIRDLPAMREAYIGAGRSIIGGAANA